MSCNCTNTIGHPAHRAVTAHHHLRQAHRAPAAVIVHRHQAHPVVIHRPVNRIIRITTVQNAQKMVATSQKQKRLQSRRSTENGATHHHHRQVRTNRSN